MKIQHYARLQRLRTRFLRAGHYVGIHKFRRHNLRPIGLEFHALKCDWCGYLKKRPSPKGAA
jgi:hypothetical protein